MNDDEFEKFVTPFINVDLVSFGARKTVLLNLYKLQIERAEQLNTLVSVFLTYDIDSFGDEVKNAMKEESFKKCLLALKTEISKENNLTIDGYTAIIDTIKNSYGLKGKELFMPIRIACIGQEHGPEMNKTMYVVGKEKILKNIDLLLERLEK
jgi:glutamyl/glutaminyl-tRNA synthetase